MQAAIDYCTPIYDALTDANAMEMVTPPTAPGHTPGSPQPRSAILIRNLAHNNEQYAVACLASNNRSKSRFAVKNTSLCLDSLRACCLLNTLKFGGVNSRFKRRVFWRQRAGTRVPGVYLGSANSLISAVLRVRRINKLRGFNRDFSSIPTAPTILMDGYLTKTRGGKKGRLGR